MALVALVTGLVPPAGGQAAPGDVPEEMLLDIGVRIFNPGVPADLDFVTLQEERIYPDIRKSEARFMAVRLMRTLQDSGRWGAVRILPAHAVTDVLVDGKILESSGLRLELEIRVADASGHLWFARRYKSDANAAAYNEETEEILRPEPFSSVYEEIAADLLKAKTKLKDDRLRELRRLSELRFAADLAPDAFDDYLDRDRRGRLEVVGLPAAGDPMLRRVEPIRARDDLFIDTITEHYVNFGARMESPYDSWRKYSFEEERARRKLQRQARTRKILGGLAILGGVMAASDRDTEGVSDVAVLGGIMAIQSGANKGREAKLHLEGLRELAESFDAEIEPILVEVEGHTVRLTGTVESQYDDWRRLLREVFAVETGQTIDPNTGEIVRDDVADDLESSNP